MAKIKSTPNLPASSRMKMPGGSDQLSSKIKEIGGMSKGAGATKKVMAAAKNKSIKSKMAC